MTAGRNVLPPTVFVQPQTIRSQVSQRDGGYVVNIKSFISGCPWLINTSNGLQTSSYHGLNIDINMEIQFGERVVTGVN